MGLQYVFTSLIQKKKGFDHSPPYFVVLCNLGESVPSKIFFFLKLPGYRTVIKSRSQIFVYSTNKLIKRKVKVYETSKRMDTVVGPIQDG